MAENVAATPLHRFLEAVRQATSSVLSRVFKGQWSVQIDSDGAPLPQASSFCFELSAAGGLQGKASLEFAVRTLLLCRRHFFWNPRARPRTRTRRGKRARNSFCGKLQNLPLPI